MSWFQEEDVGAAHFKNLIMMQKCKQNWTTKNFKIIVYSFDSNVVSDSVSKSTAVSDSLASSTVCV